MDGSEPRGGTLVNDIHSQLNATRVTSIVTPHDISELAETVCQAREQGQSVAIAGGRHAMGGQQFGDASVLVDTRSLDRVVDFDRERGIITAEGGIMWPALMEWLEQAQRFDDPCKPRPVGSIRVNPRSVVGDPRNPRPVGDPRNPRPVGDPRNPRPVGDPRNPRPVMRSVSSVLGHRPEANRRRSPEPGRRVVV